MGRDYSELVKDKKEERTALHDRMNTDRELAESKKYELTDANGHPLADSISVTLPDMAIFATNVESALGNASEQVVVESEDKNVDTAYIEDLIRAYFASANARLVKRGRFPLNPYLDQQMCRRGRGVARVFSRVDSKTGLFISDIVSFDSRYAYYKMGVEGVEWAVNETWRTIAAVRAEYPKANIKGDDKEEVQVWDCLDGEQEELWVAEEQVWTQKYPHRYERVPVAVQLVPMGSMMSDKDSQSKQGESIFFLVRDLIPELNRLVSIIQSLNMKALDSALTWPNKEGIDGTPPNYKDLTKPGSMTSTDIGARPEPVAYGELKRSAYLLNTIIETRIQRGSLSNLDMGIMGNQPWSAIALVEIGEGRDQVFLPRLGARGLLKQQIAEMFIEQIISIGATTVEIGISGHKRTFDVRKLKGEYEITFKYFIKSPKTDIARFSMAVAAGKLIPERAKRRDILQREDPEDDEKWLRYEEAELLSPAIKMRRILQALVDADENEEAELLSAEMGVNLQQMLAGDVSQMPTVEKEQKPEQVAPMFGGGGGATSAGKAAQLQAEPREGEG